MLKQWPEEGNEGQPIDDALVFHPFAILEIDAEGWIKPQHVGPQLSLTSEPVPLNGFCPYPQESLNAAIRTFLLDGVGSQEFEVLLPSGDQVFHVWSLFLSSSGKRTILAHDHTLRKSIWANLKASAQELASLSEALQNQIAGREHFQQALSESEAKNRTIVNTIADALVIIDEDFTIESSNLMATQVFGYEPDEFQGQSLRELLLFPDLDPHESTVHPDFLVGFSGELFGCCKDGSLFPAQLSVGFYMLGYNKRYTVLIHDITEQKATQDALLIAKNAAESAARIKSDFLANMSHEIRTPMNGILGVLSLLNETELSQDQRYFVDIIGSSADTLMTIINDILDFSKIEAGKLQVEAIPFSLRSCLEDAVDLFTTKAERAGLELVLDYDGALPEYVISDPNRIRQVLTNLVNNAVKFTPAGYVHVRVKMVSLLGSIVQFRIEVRDSGVGVPAAKRPLLFQKFTQADTSTSRQYGGTGLGLAICRELVSLLGGTIGIESNEGAGSVFWFQLELPVVDLEEKSSPLPALCGQRVLVVEPRSLTRGVVVRMLADVGLEVSSLPLHTDLLGFLSRANHENKPVHLLLLSLFGVEPAFVIHLLAQLRSDPRLRELKVTLVAQNSQRGIAQHLVESGAAGYLVLPLKLSGLSQVLSDSDSQEARTEIAHGDRSGPSLSDADAKFGQLLPGEEGKKPLVLLVEDNPINQKVGTRLLERAGCEVHIAANGKDALDAFLQKQFAIIFMDCQMPVMNGYEATQELRRRERALGTARKVPIIALTAHAMAGDREKCLTVGMDDYISKPIKFEVLRQKLNDWLHERKQSST